MDLVSSFTNDVVQKALDGHAMRHVAVASNLANVDTPGYKRKSVSFESHLQEALDARQDQQASKLASNDKPLGMNVTRRGHMASNPIIQELEDVQPQMSEAEDFQYRNDENAVDVESEMVSLAKNTQRYMALNNIQGRLLRSTRNVISNSGGGV